jgi:hypothetical protein
MTAVLAFIVIPAKAGTQTEAGQPGRHNKRMKMGWILEPKW